MKITSEQSAILDTLVCERLSSQEENIRLVEDFVNTRNESLEHTIKDDAYEEDTNGNIAYYLIKDYCGRILFYFSIKCGMLYDKVHKSETIRKLNQLCKILLDLKNSPTTTAEEKRIINLILESLRSRKGLKKSELQKINHNNQILDELKNETETNLSHVGRTFAGIEIVHFCANEKYKNIWNDFNFKQKMGTVVFWHFIVPKILELKEIVGCEYLFLFAADLTPDETLVNYYKANLNFTDSFKHGTAIPLYDYGCKFLYQELKDIEVRQQRFYTEFNPNEEEI